MGGRGSSQYEGLCCNVIYLGISIATVPFVF